MSTTSEVSTAASLATLTDNTSTTSTLTAPLDSESFDANTYIADLLSTRTLKDILKVEATLVSEIRNLDGERKALVYDNYSKLIKAVGTIGEMQRGMNDGQTGGLREVRGIEDKIGGLREQVKELVGDTPEVDSENTKRRRGEAKKKKIVSWVLNTPSRLQAMVEEQNQEKAQKEWEAVRALLDKWQGVAGVEDVRKRCEEAMADAKGKNGEHEDDNRSV